MFVSRVTAKGQMYFYIYAYDRTSYDLRKKLFRLGNKKKALNMLEEWQDGSKIPTDLLAQGLKRDLISNWKKKIESL